MGYVSSVGYVRSVGFLASIGILLPPPPSSPAPRPNGSFLHRRRRAGARSRSRSPPDRAIEPFAPEPSRGGEGEGTAEDTSGGPTQRQQGRLAAQGRVAGDIQATFRRRDP